MHFGIILLKWYIPVLVLVKAEKARIRDSIIPFTLFTLLYAADNLRLKIARGST